MEAFFYFVDGHGGSLILESVLLMILDEVCTMVNEFWLITNNGGCGC